MSISPLGDLDRFTAEQRYAIVQREGDLLLDAGAGSGKTSVLVERFVRAVLEDGVDVAQILTITFTEKAAAELRERIRARLRAVGADEPARATENAYISTIHGFCARVLRVHALRARLDPGFAVLDEPAAAQLADAAFGEALQRLADTEEAGVGLIAAYGAPVLHQAIRSVHAHLRSRGAVAPQLPALSAAPSVDGELARAILLDAGRAARAELAAVACPGVKVGQALDRLARLERVVEGPDPWPGDVARLALPGGNGAALSTPVCVAYGEALRAFKAVCEYGRARAIHRLLGRLLVDFAERYAALKREASAVDFEDLELIARELLGDAEVRDRYRDRFVHVMVDEMQDTNRVQLELIEQITDGNLFTVGDAQQSIYGFRHAEVELFEQRGARLEEIGRRATLQTNFRSSPKVLAAINAAFGRAMGSGFRPLLPGRAEDPGGEVGGPCVELVIADKGADWDAESLAAPWRLAEARALARRVRELCDAGETRPGEIVLLTRATTDLRAYERALDAVGVPTYVIGGRGYWAHPQVIDLLAWLRILANPRDEEALFTVIGSPLVELSLDGLVLLVNAARAARRDPWSVIRDPGDALAELDGADRERVAAFGALLASERAVATRIGAEELIERALEATGYDLRVLALAGGERRMANIRKLMRLAREHELVAGADLRGFLELVARRAGGAGGFGGGSRESEAPVESEGLDAVRLMTIHRAKGLEFPVVCVADLGRAPITGAPLIRISADGRLGLRIAEVGAGPALPALDYEALRIEQVRADTAEERRLFYVAMTRAQERLILSGAARLEKIASDRTPMGWVAPAFVPDIGSAIEGDGGVSADGIAFHFVRPETDLEPEDTLPPSPAATHSLCLGDKNSLAPAADVVPSPVASPVQALSYSALSDYQRCGYRFYTERVLKLPPSPAIVREPAAAGEPLAISTAVETPVGAMSAAERGVLVHKLLQRFDFRRPRVPDGLDPSVSAMLAGFGESELCVRLARADVVRREEPFAFALTGEVMVSGAIDVLARERGGAALVVDYKSDALNGRHPQALMDDGYATQRLIYALAALRDRAQTVEVIHVFLERPDAPLSVTYRAADVPSLEQRLQRRAAGVLAGAFPVSEQPRRRLCDGCPARDGLCSWPQATTARETTDTLF